MGKKRLTINILEPIARLPESLSGFDLALADGGLSVVYTYDTNGERTGITSLLGSLAAEGIVLKDLQTEQSSLEDIFVDMVREPS